METEFDDIRLIRFEIENSDGKLDEDSITKIMRDLADLTAEILEKYEIPGERFKITVGRTPIEKILNL